MPKPSLFVTNKFILSAEFCRTNLLPALLMLVSRKSSGIVNMPTVPQLFLSFLCESKDADIFNCPFIPKPMLLLISSFLNINALSKVNVCCQQLGKPPDETIVLESEGKLQI